jgi:prenyltransferase beta subunit
VLVAAIALAAVPAPPARAADAATRRATAYVLRAQNRDGGFGAKAGAPSAALETAWSAMGLAAVGRRPSPATGRFLAATAPRVRDTGDVERTILALVAAGRSPRSAGGVNLLTTLTRRRRSDGSFERLVNRTAFAILALRAAGRSTHDGTVRRAASWLAREQNRDGGWNFAGRGAPSGIDDTAGALQALVAAGRSRRGAVARAAGFITRNQNPDGGFPLQPGSGSNAQSTAWAVQGLVAAGRDPGRVRRGGSRTPLGYLRTLVASNGSVRYSRTSAQTPVWVTAQALTGLARRPFPVRAPRR